jgi:hypothetical protein
MDDGILDQAKGKAQASLRALLSGLGLRVVAVKRGVFPHLRREMWGTWFLFEDAAKGRMLG